MSGRTPPFLLSVVLVWHGASVQPSSLAKGLTCPKTAGFGSESNVRLSSHIVLVYGGGGGGEEFGWMIWSGLIKDYLVSI